MANKTLEILSNLDRSMKTSMTGVDEVLNALSRQEKELLLRLEKKGLSATALPVRSVGVQVSCTVGMEVW